jgi:hypothetical protein
MGSKMLKPTKLALLFSRTSFGIISRGAFSLHELTSTSERLLDSIFGTNELSLQEL